MFRDASRTGTKNIGARRIPSTDKAFERFAIYKLDRLKVNPEAFS